MKTRISLLCAAGALMVIFSGCTTTKLSQTPLSPEEAQWAEYISSSYSEWTPPRTVPPNSNGATGVAGEVVVIQEQQPVPVILTPIEQAPSIPVNVAPVVAGKKKVEAQTYTIQKGDTLSIIAKKIYGKASKWNVILAANKDKISDAGKLKVGMTINIPAE